MLSTCAVFGYPNFAPLQRRKMPSISVPHILLHRVEMAAEKSIAGQQSKATIALKEKRLNLSEKPPIFGGGFLHIQEQECNRLAYMLQA